MSDNIKIVPVEDDRTKTTQITKIASKLIVSNNRATL